MPTKGTVTFNSDMNKRQRIATWIIGYFLFVIYLSSNEVALGLELSVSWIVIGGLLLILLRDKK